MTTDQVFIVAVIGGLTVVVGLIIAAALFTGFYLAFFRLADWRKARRARRYDLRTCRAIEALGTTESDHPQN